MSQPAPPAHRNFWDLAYDHGDHLEHWEALETPPGLVEAIERGWVGRQKTALDIGCGAGREALFLAGQGVSVMGVDSSPVALELARSRADEAGVVVDWREGDATRLPVPDNAIDFALDRGCFHVIDRKRRRRYAREVSRVLRPGARLLLYCARDDDEELGLVGVSRQEIDRLFIIRGFECEINVPLSMEARSGSLPAQRMVLRLTD